MNSILLANKHFVGVFLVAIFSVSMSGCLDKGKDKIRETKLQGAKMGDLRPVNSDNELIRYLRNGILAQASGGNVYAAFDSPTAMLGTANATEAFSETNVQVNGVDEADVLKYDGSTLFITKEPESYYPWTVSQSDQTFDEDEYAKVRVFSTSHNPATPTHLGDVALSEAGVSIRGMYLTEGDDRQLTAITSNFPEVWAFGIWFDPWFWDDGRSGIHIFDATDPLNLDETFKLEIEGLLVDSRRIGDQLYLVTRFTPRVDGLIYYPETADQKRQNQALVDSMSWQDLTPKFTLNDGVEQSLLGEEDCFLPEETASDEGYTTLITITTVNLSSKTVSAKCVGGYSDGIFASTTGLYLFAATDDQTAIHKFGFVNNDVDYFDTTSVVGHLGWRNPSFRLGENNGHLFVLSSQWQANDEGNWTPTHYLNALKVPETNSDIFELTARLPNDNRPEAIGKPGEDIFAVRYFGDRAYAVTFERIDPLYVFDLSNPNDPLIAGELEVDGFSDYLHPLNSQFVLGLGHDSHVDAEGLALGVKLELFDVSDISQPQSVNAIVLGKRGSYSEATSDHHAFTVLPVDDNNFRIAIPVQRHETLPNDGNPDDVGQWYQWTDYGLHLFNVNTSAQPSLEKAGEMITETRTTQDDYRYHWHARSVLHGDSIFFSNNSQLWAADWQTPETINGPH